MISEKYGIVTGASRGIGAAMAEELAEQGYDVVITYNNRKEQAEAVKADLESKYSIRAEIYQLAIEDEEGVKAFRVWCEETMGPNLCVLVNNAGIYCNCSVEKLDPELFNKMIDTNVKGTFYVTHYFADLMIARKYGKIVNVSSVAGLQAARGYTAYSGSKFAVRGMTQAMACDLAEYNIQVNCLAPAVFKTDMLLDACKINPSLMDQRIAAVPLHRVGEVVEARYALKYFLESDFITGQVVSPNGGLTMI